MNWYYVSNGKQAGPVDDSELERLVQSGSVLFDTLIWREGMADWKPYSQVQVPPVRPLPASMPLIPLGPVAPLLSPDQAVCSECGRVFSKDNLIAHRGSHVCAGCKPLFIQRVAEGAWLNVQAGGPIFAGFWIRLGAKVLDMIIMMLLFVPAGLWLLLNTLRPRTGSGPTIIYREPSITLQLLIQLGALALILAYQTFFIGKFGATIGKMACDLRVVAPDSTRITYARAAGRALAELLSLLVLLVGYVIAAFDPEKRALHNHMCSTRVVHK